MLTSVGGEGLIYAIPQRLLRGHPNIVYLIDAAWAKMPSGNFEVYILMEYCPGLLKHLLVPGSSNGYFRWWCHRYDESSTA